jgi:hypothetical protein
MNFSFIFDCYAKVVWGRTLKNWLPNLWIEELRSNSPAHVTMELLVRLYYNGELFYSFI